MAVTNHEADLLVLCARIGLRLFEDYLVCDGDIVVTTEQGQRRLEQAAATDPVLAEWLYEASGAEIEKLLDHGSLSWAMRRRLARFLAAST